MTTSGGISPGVSESILHYTRSHDLDVRGSVSEHGILQVCQAMAHDEEGPKVAVQHLLRYFRICTEQVDPKATLEELERTFPMSSRMTRS